MQEWEKGSVWSCGFYSRKSSSESYFTDQSVMFQKVLFKGMAHKTNIKVSSHSLLALAI